MTFATPKVLVPLARRSKQAKRHIRRLERYKKDKVDLAFAEYYKDAIF